MKQPHVNIRILTIENTGGYMSHLRLSILIVFIFFASNSAHFHDHKVDEFLALYEDVDVSITEGSIILAWKYDNSEFVEITDDYNLYVNGNKVKLNRDQKELVAEYYDLLESIIEYAKEIGLESARIGVAGAKIGLKALVGAMKALLTEYESDKLEEDLEDEGKQLEEMARDLEDKAEDLEHLAEALEKTHKSLHKEIPQLRELKWF